MKVLVTGSSGWLGRHLIPFLKLNGHEPCGLDVVPSEWTDFVMSVGNRAALEKLFAVHEFEGIIHAGALHKPDIVRYPQSAFVDVNITGTLNLLEIACERKLHFVFTSTTSLMISQKIRDEKTSEAIWLDEEAGPLEPRNIYGVTKLAAGGLCRQHHLERGLDVIILRTSRFFPEADDTINNIDGENLKANELLNRRATVEDMARAHIMAMEKLSTVNYGLYIVSAPTPFARRDVQQLKEDAASIIRQKFPQVEALYQHKGWKLPTSLGRIYDGTRIMRELGFEYETSFKTVINALAVGESSPISHDESYTSPQVHLR